MSSLKKNFDPNNIDLSLIFNSEESYLKTNKCKINNIDLDNIIKILTDHINRTDNPHKIKPADIDLGNVDNTADLDKPVSNATKEYILEKLNEISIDNIDLSDYIKKEDLEVILNLKADKANTYTKEEIDNALSYKAETNNTYTKDQINILLSQKENKNESYTKDEINSLLSDFKKSHYEKVTVLPEKGNISTIYLLKKSGNSYSQYIYEDGEWIDLGSTELNLENYYTKDEINELLENLSLNNPSNGYVTVKAPYGSKIINTEEYETISDGLDEIIKLKGA